MPLINNIINCLGFFVDFRKDVEVFGMYHRTNLGDEAMRIAALSIIPNHRAVAVVSDSEFSLFNRMKRAKRRRELLLGGGTLIHGSNDRGENHWLDYVEMRLNQGSRISVFGTGIAFHQTQIDETCESFKRWGRILKHASDLELRGPISQEIAASMGVNSFIFGDFVFSLFKQNVINQRQSLPSKSNRIIGFNIGECLGDQIAYENLCGNIIDKLSKEFFIRFFIVTCKDIQATANVIRKCNLKKTCYQVINNYVNTHEYIETVIHCDAFIGLKLHAAALAMISGVPTLLFEYLPKCRDFVLPIDLGHCLLSLSLNRNAVELKIEDLLKYPENYINIDRIREFSDSQRRKIVLRFGNRSPAR